ncbi:MULTISPECIES: NADP-dependent oxidoreductase [Caulobacter]|jgi:NADPH:quinone reductase-like Zn-dependent oxidoreductase|uniref:NADPH:quinone reductase-like Zn-dependent oxidoreductase n=1 Tax=Caulobacter rhizosphaerae TaxID=2010972 RepID=A0ABU1N3Y3_9CAUL|nr:MULTISPECIES: NADP-dependent oxidoreductase [Caulobacter]KQZ33755.1 NADPH:quinone oxidoreductase [Caulobacter sp. Root1472]MDR6532796.1 NADPH:quinone reductase-like Zn-dependent oxidoreductase [Caulobacter rhizosphaerae]
MKAYILDRYGKGQPLRLGDWPDPVAGPGQVLVDIRAAALNMLDAKIRDGAFKPILPYRPPFVLGHDLAGVVSGVGPGVSRFKVGDEVFARPRDHQIGAFAERIAVAEADLAPKPTTLSMVEAASLPLVALTAWQVLVEAARVKRGDKVMIHAGSGGVGTIAIQLAKHLGATVATTTSAGNAELVGGLGADVVIDYKTQDFTERLSGYDVVLSSLEDGTLQRSLKILKPGGKLISISGPPDPAFARAQGMNWLMRQVVGLLSRNIRREAARRQVEYSFLFMRADGGQLAQIAALVDSGALRPVIDRVFAFDALNEAMAYLATGRAKGKVVIAR